MAVGYVGAQDDYAVCRNEISLDFIIGNCFPSENPGWRIEPKHFLNYHAGVGEPGEMLYRWQLPIQYLVQLTMEAAFDLRMLGK